MKLEVESIFSLTLGRETLNKELRRKVRFHSNKHILSSYISLLRPFSQYITLDFFFFLLSLLLNQPFPWIQPTGNHSYQN